MEDPDPYCPIEEELKEMKTNILGAVIGMAMYAIPFIILL